MTGVRLVLAFHHHQSVGQSDEAIDSAYHEVYLPILEVLETFPEVAFAQHLSGPLLDWLLARRPEYVSRMRSLVELGRVEILGGGRGAPILAMLPTDDRLGQLRRYSALLEETFQTRIRGAWLPRSIWEQGVASSLADAGLEYAAIDTSHVVRAGMLDGCSRRYVLTEDQGRLLKAFPIDQGVRDLLAAGDLDSVSAYLKRASTEAPEAVVVLADDGSAFGRAGVPFDGQKLRAFCDLLLAKREWLHPSTFSRTLDATLPAGMLYLPESLDDQAPSGSWRNALLRSPEASELHARMLGLSARIRTLLGQSPVPMEDVLAALDRAQCHDAYGFGPRPRPELLQAAYANLIEAHDRIDRIEGIGEEHVAIEVGDFNLDARQEVRLENALMIAYVRPAHGGHLYELDLRRERLNLLATSPIRSTRSGSKAFVDRFFDPGLTLDRLGPLDDSDRGDFASGTYLSRLHRTAEGVALIMERPGRAGGETIQLRKVVSLEPGGGTIEVQYLIEDLPPGTTLHFGVEINLAGMTGGRQGSSYSTLDGEPLGPLDARLDLASVEGLASTDEGRKLTVSLDWSRPGQVWALPIDAPQPGGGGPTSQGSTILPRWKVTGDQEGRWEVSIRLTAESFLGDDGPASGPRADGAVVDRG